MSESSLNPHSGAAPKSKLNPFAREFKLNVNAPSFTPGSKPAKPHGSAPSSGPPGQGAGQGVSPASLPSLPPPQAPAGPRPGWALLHGLPSAILPVPLKSHSLSARASSKPQAEVFSLFPALTVHNHCPARLQLNPQAVAASTSKGVCSGS